MSAGARKRARGGLLALGLAGCTAEAPPSLAQQSGAVHAATEPQAPDPAVVAIVKRRARCSEPVVQAFCTGVLVADRVVLTAAHCVLAEPPLDIEVYLGPDVNGGSGVFVPVVHQQVHPGYDAQSFASDLALLLLVTGPGVAPVAAAPAPAPAPGDPVRVVGFGEADGLFGVKKAGISRVASVDQGLLRTEPGPSLACGGDSGAPVFDAQGRLVALVRSGDLACKVFTNATLLGPFLENFIAPYAAAPPSPSRRPVSASEDLCAQPCADDDDCPRAMLCLPERELGPLCGHASLRSGLLGETCAADADCASGTCAALADDARSCRCFTPCRDLPPAPAPARPATLDLAGGCSASPSAPPAGAWGLLTALALAARRGSARRPAPRPAAAAPR